MIPTSDPLERLRGANPVPPSTVAQVRPDPVLFRAIVSGRPLTAPKPARRKRRILVPALAVTCLLGGAAGYGVFRDPVPKPQNAGCYESADLESRTLVVGVGREGPVAACAEVWRQGLLGPGGQVPPLTECVLSTGVVGVFPGAGTGVDVCTSLGVPPTTAATPTTAARPAVDVTERFRLFREAVVPQFADAACVDPRSAGDIVRRELDRAGLGDWRVSTTGEFSPDRACASLGFRPEAGEILLVPSPARR